MSKVPVAGTDSSEVLERLAVGPRREIMTTLRDRASPVPVEELATVLVAAVDDRPLVDVTREDRDAMALRLRHVDLPALEDVDLVRWDRSRETARAAEHPALADEGIWNLLESDSDGWEDVLAAISNRDRRRILSILKAESGGESDVLDRRELARCFVEWDDGSDNGEPSYDTVEAVERRLVHVDLPALEQADLIARRDSSITYVGHPELDAAALDFDQPFGGEDRSERIGSGDIRTLTGRRNVLDHGQSLVDRATAEIFLMITSDGLLEEACVEKIRAAIDRGVDVYVGSQTPAVRDFVREELPGATIWEPQLDWLNLPPSDERLGRLLFVDREAIMLGTIGQDKIGNPHETAIAGEGANNSLVVLLREMLGTRIDHLDLQSDDVLSYLPL